MSVNEEWLKYISPDRIRNTCTCQKKENISVQLTTTVSLNKNICQDCGKRENYLKEKNCTCGDESQNKTVYISDKSYESLYKKYEYRRGLEWGLRQYNFFIDYEVSSFFKQ